MIIEEKYRSCVVHLFHEDTATGTWEAIGTAFYMAHVKEGAPCWIVYLVTARHVVEQMRPVGPIYVRINQHAGGYRDVPTLAGDWFCHPSTDIAVLRVTGGETFSGGAMIMPLHFDVFIRPEYERRIHTGDEIAFVGLFKRYPGRHRNEPVVRFGKVARLRADHEPIEIDLGGLVGTREVDAFLIEAQSWGGHSGSPAFMYWPANIEPELHNVPDQIRAWGRGDITKNRGPWLLGLVHGHLDVFIPIKDPAFPERGATMPVNAGLVVVIPAVRLYELLEMPELQADREEAYAAERRKRPLPTPDATS